MRRPVGAPVLWTALAAAVALGQITPASGQPAPPAAPAPPSAPPSPVPGAPVPPGPPVAAPGMRIATGQAAVVGGNAAGARERALDEATRQAVDMALGELVDPATRAAQVKTVKAILAKARSFVPRYRTLEEGEVGGVYTIRLEAEVDETALRRKLEAATTTGPAHAPPARPGARGALVVAERGGGGAAFLPGFVAALGAAGLRARAGDAAEGDLAPAALAAAAARAGVSQAIAVSAEASDEGAVRGTARSSAACKAGARVVSAPPSTATADRSASTRVFVDHPDGRAECYQRLATELAGRVAGALDAPVATAAGDLRAVTLDVDVVEPAAVPLLLKSLRAIGAVSGAEVRQLLAGRAEVKVTTRAAPAVLVGALSRDPSPMITFSDVQASGEAIRLRVRLRPVAVAPAATP